MKYTKYCLNLNIQAFWYNVGFLANTGLKGKIIADKLAKQSTECQHNTDILFSKTEA